MKKAGALVVVLGWVMFFFGLALEASMALNLDLSSVSENVTHLGYFLFLAGLLKEGLDTVVTRSEAEVQVTTEAAPQAVPEPSLDISMLVDNDCERGTIGGRRYVARNDGSLDMETAQGWKRFRSMDEALAQIAVH